MAELYVARKRAEERNPLPYQYRHASDGDAIDQAGAREALDGDSAVDVEVVRAFAASSATISAGSPDMWFDNGISDAGEIDGWLLRTTTAFIRRATREMEGQLRTCCGP